MKEAPRILWEGNYYHCEAGRLNPSTSTVGRVVMSSSGTIVCEARYTDQMGAAAWERATGDNRMYILRDCVMSVLVKPTIDVGEDA